MGEESKGIHEILFNTINESDIDLRAQYYQQIVLSGGTTMFPGLTTRLEKEVKRQYLTTVCVACVSWAERRCRSRRREEEGSGWWALGWQNGKLFCLSSVFMHVWLVAGLFVCLCVM
jgi:actin-related protein